MEFIPTDALDILFLIGSWVSVTYTFTPSTTIRSSEVNQNFADLVAAIEKAMPSSASGHGIIAWHGAVANVPSGWYLCDGNNSTPDLRGKFILGAGGAYSVGATGGAENKTMSTSEMPIHTHVQNAHNHAVSANQSGQSNGTDTNSGKYAWNDPAYAGLSVRATHHAEATAVNQDAGGGASFSLMNPYHALCWIMKS